MTQALTYLNKAVEARRQVEKMFHWKSTITSVFSSLPNKTMTVPLNFTTALGKLDDRDFKSPDGDTLVDLPQDLRTSLTYNLARTKEISNQKMHWRHMNNYLQNALIISRLN